VKVGHYSVTEHAHVGVFIEGISRGCSHELVRHRHFNWSQRSTRYTEEGGAAMVLEPYYAEIYARFQNKEPVSGPELAALNSAMLGFENDLKSYNEQLRCLETMNPKGLKGKELRKWARGKARQSLPHSLETRLVMTGNTSSWRHFFLMRTGRGAEPEIRRLAQVLWAVVTPIVPRGYQDLQVAEYDGFIEVTKP
jgi:thymidylate synthase (FAD)